MKFWPAIIGGIACCGFAFAAELPDVSDEAIADLGITSGTPQMNGFVFIEGRYLPPPYTVTRKGNALFINRIQFERPVEWPIPDSTAAAVEAPKKKADADGDFQEVGAAAAKPAEAPKAKAVKSIDDLFADESASETKQKKQPAAGTKSAETAQPAAETAPAPAAAAAAPASARANPSVRQAPEDAARQKDALRTNLDNLRKSYEQALAKGDFFFFNRQYNRLNGNYGTARALIGVLPDALRQSQSPQDLLQRLNQGGIYFVDLGICASLYRYKNTFVLLDERLKKIKENEEFEAARRSRSQSW